MFFLASHHQERIWFIDKFERGYLYEHNPIYHNIPVIIKYKGKLNNQLFENALNHTISNNEILRTQIVEENSLLYQKITDYSIQLEVINNNILNENEILSYLIHEAETPFDFSNDLFIRVKIFNFKSDINFLLFIYHHIICDRYSALLIVRDVLTNYKKIISEESIDCDNNIQYFEYSEWQRNLDKTYYDYLLTYWKTKLKGKLEVLKFPIDITRPHIHIYNAGRKKIEFEENLYRNIDEFGLKNSYSNLAIFLAAFKVLLQKYTHQSEIIIGTSFDNRDNSDLINSIGSFSNLVALRDYIVPTKSFLEVCFDINKTLNEAKSYKDFPFDKLVSELNPEKDMSRTALFDILFQYEENSIKLPSIDGINFELVETNLGFGKYDLNFLIKKVDNFLMGFITYNSLYFKEETINRLIDNYLLLLDNLIAQSNIPISEFEVVSLKEKHKLLEEYNHSTAFYPKEKRIHEFFEEQVKNNPKGVALILEGQQMTYGELNNRSNQLAHLLISKGVSSDVIVGLMLDRSFEMIIGILGILKAGGAYLPIDPTYPEERKKYILGDSNVDILLTSKKSQSDQGYSQDIVYIDEIYYQGEEISNPKKNGSSKDLAYVIYTSGSTGKPKGALIEHRNVVSLLFPEGFQFEFTSEDVWTMFHSYCFDFSVWEMYGALFYGGKLVIVPKIVSMDTRLFIELLKRDKVSVLNQTPSAFYNLSRHQEAYEVGINLRYVIFGGEALSPSNLKQWKERYPGTKMINMYGITETTVHVSYKEITENEIESGLSNIGKPIPSLQAYIFDDNLKLVPEGVTGELFIGGEGVCRGYLDHPELSQMRFIDNPYKEGELIYVTGDLGKWLSNGDIEYLGRKDSQVKIRGFRIELGEIESVIRRHINVEEVLVLDKEGSTREKYLCAYLVGEKIADSELRSYISVSLPTYMVPSFFVWLEKMPLTSNGKIDRKALPNPDIGEGAGYEAPRNETEKNLVKIWSEVLQVEEAKIGITNDFFDLGGHSLRATVLVSKIHKEFNRRIPLAEIFKNPTIRGISEYIGNTQIAKHKSIPQAEKKEYYSITSTQHRLYILQQFDKTSIAYNMPAIFEIQGELDYIRVDKTFQLLIEKYESLRTSFITVNDEYEPKQKIHSNIGFAIERSTIKKEQLSEEIRCFIKPFVLDQTPLLRVKLIKVSEDRHILVYDMHHIISDGITLNNIIKDFKELYSKDQYKALSIQYKDYSEWFSRYLKYGKIQEQDIYWKKQFTGEIPILELPTDNLRPALQKFDGNKICFVLGKHESEGLYQIAKETGSTLYVVLLSIFNIFLSKLSGQEDIVVGTPIAGRNHADLENLVGVFVNTLAIRSYPESFKCYRDYLQEVKEISLQAFTNSDYPYENLVEQLPLKRDTSRNALFDVMFVLQNMSISEVSLPNLTIKPYEHTHTVSKFDLTLIAIEHAAGILLTFEYSTNLFKCSTIERFIKYFREIIEVLQKRTDLRLSEIEIVPAEEKQKLLEKFNKTASSYPREKRIHEFFEDQVKKNPKMVALLLQEQQMTYGELNNRSNQLAQLLISKGVTSDVIVGLMVERSFDMIIGIFGILKAGGAYLPIDPTYPEERKKYILRDSNVEVLLTNKINNSGNHYNLEVIYIDEISYHSEEIPNLGKNGSSKDLAYVIYTSGSTGKPKGVLIEHRSLVNRLHWMQKEFKLEQKDTLLQKSPYTFDVSVWELLWWSMYGSKSSILEPGAEKDPALILRAIEKDKVTVIHFVPSMLLAFLNYVEDNNLQDRLISLKEVIVSGEALTIIQYEKFEKLLGPKTRLTNLYGPTEATIDVSCYHCEGINTESMSSIPIGKAIDNTKLYVIDNSGKLQPIGISGELYILGDNLARGYCNNVILTNDKFCRIEVNDKKELAYKTGDLAKFQTDGNIEFIGRKDNQVKIRGNRIELGEIENVILKHPKIEEVVVVDKKEKDQGEKYLVGYLVGERIEDNELRSYLTAYVPTYMVPSFFVWLDRLPLTLNGKVDRKVLPEPVIGEIKNYVVPSSEIEKKLVKIWSEVLQIEEEKIGVTSNFFELGGHSLRATILVSKLHKEFNKQIPLAEVFKIPTIRGLSQYIGEAKIKRHSSIPKAEKKEYHSLSSAQKRLYIVQQMDVNNVAYNMPQVVLLEENITKEQIQAVFREIISRHESLRTSFKIIEENPVQITHNQIELEIEDYTLKDNDIEYIKRQFVRPFNLSQAPLFRVGFIEGYSSGKILLLDMHHIITDGVSNALLVKEFRTLLKGEKLKLITFQYKDYSEWQANREHHESIKRQESYWLNELSGTLPVLELPTDYKRPVIKSHEGSFVRFELNEKQTRQIREICNLHGVSIYMYLMSVFKILLAKISGQEELIVGMPIAGRPQSDLQEIIGNFVNMLALRSNPEGEKIFVNYLKELKIKMLKAYENQECQFEDIVGKVSVSRDTSRNPVFDVAFNFINFVEQAENNGIPEKLTELEWNRSIKFDLNLSAFETQKRIIFELEYCSQLFKPIFIEHVIEYYKIIIDTSLINPNTEISKFQLLTEEERFNLINICNSTETEYSSQKSIINLFSEVVDRTPDRVAVVFNNEFLTYKELDRMSDYIATLLTKIGLDKDKISCIVMDRSAEWITAILGILKAKGGYLPIEPDSPVERIKYMIEDAKAHSVITQRKYKDSFGDYENVLFIDDLLKYDSNNPVNLKTLISPENIAYIIYTSGTTGKPKGVIIEHKSVINLSEGIKKTYLKEYDTKLNISMISPFVFDASVKQIFGSLLNEHTLFIVPEKVKLQPELMLKFYNKYCIDIADGTPSYIQLLTENFINSDPISVKHFVIGGEKLTNDILEKFTTKYRFYPKITNVYGPTECCDVTCFLNLDYKGDGYQKISIGKPMPNCKVYILDKYLNPVPVNMFGEIYISGVGVARGYNGAQETGEARFLENPYYNRYKLFKTGDIGRWLSDGNIDILGRHDNQIKINGFRIEIEEIENILNQFEKIDRAIVTTIGIAPNIKLHAYYVAETELEKSEIRNYLMRFLPSYMIPTLYSRIDKIHINKNGKVDKTKLPVLNENSHLEYIAPRTDIEKILTEVCKRVLDLDKISIDSNFFELGANSIQIVKISSILNSEHLVNVSVLDIFRYATIKELGEQILSVKHVTEKDAQSDVDTITLLEQSTNYFTNNIND